MMRVRAVTKRFVGMRTERCLLLQREREGRGEKAGS